LATIDGACATDADLGRYARLAVVIKNLDTRHDTGEGLGGVGYLALLDRLSVYLSSGACVGAFGCNAVCYDDDFVHLVLLVLEGNVGLAGCEVNLARLHADESCREGWVTSNVDGVATVNVSDGTNRGSWNHDGYARQWVTRSVADCATDSVGLGNGKNRAQHHRQG